MDSGIRRKGPVIKGGSGGAAAARRYREAETAQNTELSYHRRQLAAAQRADKGKKTEGAAKPGKAEIH